MSWISVNDRLPDIERRVFVAGDYIPLDHRGRFTHGIPQARRREYDEVAWFWTGEEWRATVGINWWYDDETNTAHS